MKFLFLLTLLLLLKTSLFAKGTTEALGDIFQIALPLSAYGTALYLDDTEGEHQFYKAYGTTLATTYTLKYTVKEKRPDSENRDSFPSGHTASAFGGASFIHLRYGWEAAIVPYIAAIYTGYSRVASNKHFTHDVLAGATIGILSNWFFVTPYKNMTLYPQYGANFKGLTLSYSW